MCWPWTLFAAGGKKLFQIEDAFRATRTTTPTVITAATSQPTIVRDDGLLPGVVDIDGPRTQSARRTRIEHGAGGSGRGRWAALTAPNHNGTTVAHGCPARHSGCARRPLRLGHGERGLRATMTAMPGQSHPSMRRVVRRAIPIGGLAALAA